MHTTDSVSKVSYDFFGYIELVNTFSVGNDIDNTGYIDLIVGWKRRRWKSACWLPATPNASYTSEKIQRCPLCAPVILLLDLVGHTKNLMHTTTF